MPPRRSRPPKDFRERLLAQLLPRLATPTEAHPTVRCWSEAALHAELVAIRRQLEGEGVPSPPTATALIDWLQEIKLAHLLPLEQAVQKGRGRFFSLSLERSTQGIQVHPIELLQASTPRGVVCYFTALSFHSLTTQQPSHHTIAELGSTTARSARTAGVGVEGSTKREAATAKDSPRSTPRRPSNPLGTHLFTYEGTPYYRSRREARFVVGVQQRYLDSRTMFRITTREQTLLDTLHRPGSCGGPEVIFESWRTATEELNERELLAVLGAINTPELWRRTAAMLAQVEYQPGRELRSALTEHQQPHATPIPLLPGMSYTALNAPWRVLVPR